MPARKERDYTFHHSQEDLFEIDIVAPLSKKHEQFLNDEQNDIVIFGGAAGSGKTQLALFRLLQSSMYDPDFVAGIFRKSQKAIKGPGSLWETGNQLFKQYGAGSNSLEMMWRFESGATVKATHLHDNQDDMQGMQMTKAIVDEAAQVKEADFWYLLSRLRSKSKQRHQVLATCNPDRDSFLCEWLWNAGYLLESGLPDEKMDGKTTYVVQVNGSLKFHKTKAEVVELYGKEAGQHALSLVFYSANVYDNPWIRKAMPEYVYKLENMERLERERLLLGNWFATKGSEGFLQREHFEEVPLTEVPLNLPTARAWDFAATKPSEANPDPDWSVGIKCSYDKESGIFYILDKVQMRDRAALVENLMLTTASEDGKDVYQIIPADPGAAGKQVAHTKKSRLMRQGNRAVLSKTSSSKLNRATDFIIAAQEGNVKVVKGVFSSEDYRELEAFNGKRNGWHDDQIDALSDCFNTLAKGNLVAPIRVERNNPRLAALGGSTLL